MGHDYSYTQPSSSDDDINFFLEEEAKLYRDEAESYLNLVEQVEYTPQPEADEGIPRTCYCGNELVLATSTTHTDPGRRYYMCENVDNGDCHIWKWWDVAVTEEMSEFQRQLRLLKDQGFECEQKLVKLQKIVCELKQSVCEQKQTEGEQRKRVWEQNITYIRVMFYVLTVIIGLAVMFLSGRGSMQ